MRPTSFTLTGSPQSKIVPIDIYLANFNVSFEAQVTGTITWGLEKTNDDIFDPNVTPVWFNTPVTAMNPGATATQRGSDTAPCRAYRFSTTSGTGSIACRLIQQGVN